MSTPAVEKGVSPRSEMQMIWDIDLTRLARVVGESVATVRLWGNESISSINCDSLGLSLMTALTRKKKVILRHIFFKGPRPAHPLNDGRVAVVWGEEGDSVAFVHRPKEVYGGTKVVDVVGIVKGREFSDVTIPLDTAPDEIKRAAEFVEKHTVVVSRPRSLPDGSY